MSVIVNGTDLGALTIGSGLTFVGGELAAMWSAGDVVAVGAGLVENSGTLTANWSAPAVGVVGAGLEAASGTLSAEWSAGAVDAVGAGLASAGGTLEAAWTIGQANELGTGLVLNAGTLSSNVVSGAWNTETVTPANGGTVTVPAVDLLLVAGSAPLTTLTVALPAGQPNGRPTTLVFQQGVATLDLVAPSGASFVGTVPTAAAAGGSFRSVLVGTLVVPA